MNPGQSRRGRRDHEKKKPALAYREGEKKVGKRKKGEGE